MNHFIREWRKDRGLTQAQLAARIGIARSYLSKIESGTRRYDQPCLEAAATALRCEPGDLISRVPGESPCIGALWTSLTAAERVQGMAVLMAMFGRRSGG